MFAEYLNKCKNIINDFMDTVSYKIKFLYCCPICKIYAFQLVCNSCVNRLNLLKSHIINIETHEHNTFLNSSNISYLDNTLALNITNIYFAYHYFIPLKELLHQFKYYKHSNLAIKLSYLFYPTLKQIIIAQEIDILIPIPLHKLRLKQRGFNQSELLLKYFKMHHKNYVKNHLVYRTINTTHLALSKNSQARLKEIKNAFAINKKHIKEIYNKHILLIDDVYTTGSTSNELARVLKLHGAKQVDVCCFLKN